MSLSLLFVFTFVTFGQMAHAAPEQWAKISNISAFPKALCTVNTKHMVFLPDGPVGDHYRAYQHIELPKSEESAAQCNLNIQNAKASPSQALFINIATGETSVATEAFQQSQNSTTGIDISARQINDFGCGYAVGGDDQEALGHLEFQFLGPVPGPVQATAQQLRYGVGEGYTEASLIWGPYNDISDQLARKKTQCELAVWQTTTDKTGALNISVKDGAVYPADGFYILGGM
jgi:hypothetical protein